MWIHTGPYISMEAPAKEKAYAKNQLKHPESSNQHTRDICYNTIHNPQLMESAEMSINR